MQNSRSLKEAFDLEQFKSFHVAYCYKFHSSLFAVSCTLVCYGYSLLVRAGLFSIEQLSLGFHSFMMLFIKIFFSYDYR